MKKVGTTSKNISAHCGIKQIDQLLLMHDFTLGHSDFTVDFWAKVRGVICFSHDCEQCKHRLRCITDPRYKLNNDLLDLSQIDRKYRDSSMFVNGEKVITAVEVDLKEWTHIAIVRGGDQ